MAASALNAAATRALSPESSGGMRLRRIALHHAVLNPISCRVAEKAAFALAGVMRQATTDVHGKPILLRDHGDALAHSAVTG